jgi:hypothetical protein
LEALQRNVPVLINGRRNPDMKTLKAITERVGGKSLTTEEIARTVTAFAREAVRLR